MCHVTAVEIAWVREKEAKLSPDAVDRTTAGCISRGEPETPELSHDAQNNGVQHDSWSRPVDAPKSAGWRLDTEKGILNVLHPSF